MCFLITNDPTYSFFQSDGNSTSIQEEINKFFAISDNIPMIPASCLAKPELGHSDKMGEAKN